MNASLMSLVRVHEYPVDPRTVSAAGEARGTWVISRRVPGAAWLRHPCSMVRCWGGGCDGSPFSAADGETRTKAPATVGSLRQERWLESAGCCARDAF